MKSFFHVIHRGDKNIRTVINTFKLKSDAFLLKMLLTNYPLLFLIRKVDDADDLFYFSDHKTAD